MNNLGASWASVRAYTWQLWRVPRERTELPSIIYRLTCEPPFKVVFPSATFHVRFIVCLPAGRHELTAHDHARAVEAILASYQSAAKLRDALFVTGFPVRVDTLGATVMRGVFRDRRAIAIGQLTSAELARLPDFR